MKELLKIAETVTKDSMFFYFIVAISALQLYKIYLDESLYCGVMFILTIAVMCQLTQNKSLCLLAGLVVTNFVLGCSKLI